MPPPLRRPRQKSAPASNDKRRFTLRLSVPMVSLLGLVLMAAVGWSFFMGFMVGRGQNPEQRVEQMTGLQLDGQGRQNGLRGQHAPQAAEVVDPAVSGALAGTGTEAAANAASAQPAGTPAAAGQTGHPPSAAETGTPAGNQEAGAGTDYPFERPSGESLAAWGIKQPRPGAQSSEQAAAQAAPNARNAVTPNTAPGQGKAPGTTVAQEQLYDYVFQVAAFKGEDDADRLRKRLEGRGLRTRLQKSGKVQLVMVNLRGTELDAANLREELKRMKLGAPIQASQKAVPGKSRKTGR